MKKVRLRTFVILSLVLHIILLSSLVAILLPKRTRIKNGLYPISVGIVRENRGLNNAEDNSSNLIPLNVSKRSETPKNIQLEKMGISQTDNHEKTTRKIGLQEKKTAEKKFIKNKTSESSESNVKETEIVNNNLAFRNTENATNNARTGILSGDEAMDPRIDIGTNSQTQNIERAFPDYKANPKPRYPMLARRKGYEGTILLRVFVLESGGVGKVELEKSSGYEILDESALKTVKDWLFVPGKKGGEPIPSWVTVPIKFQLNSG